MAKISIIIPCKGLDFYAQRCLNYCLELDEAKEVFIVDDAKCLGLPSEKRNWAMQRASGDYFAFIDSDAYPSKDWLKNALFWLQCFPVVCGPGVLPPGSSFSEKIADQVHKWVFCPYRVMPKKPRMVPWHPTFNLIVRREVASKFESYLTGEDDRFCLKIPEGIFYHPDILVYHNRRGAFKYLWKQFATYARHKGAFVGLAFAAWLSTICVYAVNWVIGFIRRKP